MSADDEKPARFGCLAAARWALASAVTAAILVVIVYAVVIILRPGDLTLRIHGGHVSVSVPVHRNASTPDSVLLNFTLRAVNPSGRVRIYYTGITCTLHGAINGTAMDFLMFNLDKDIAVVQQSYADIFALAEIENNTESMPQTYFDWLSAGRPLPDVMLSLNGIRTVENYSGHNKTSEPGTIYYCMSLTVGGDDDPGAANADVQCIEHLQGTAAWFKKKPSVDSAPSLPLPSPLSHLASPPEILAAAPRTPSPPRAVGRGCQPTAHSAPSLPLPPPVSLTWPRRPESPRARVPCSHLPRLAPSVYPPAPSTGPPTIAASLLLPCAHPHAFRLPASPPTSSPSPSPSALPLPLLPHRLPHRRPPPCRLPYPSSSVLGPCHPTPPLPLLPLPRRLGPSLSRISRSRKTYWAGASTVAPEHRARRGEGPGLLALQHGRRCPRRPQGFHVQQYPPHRTLRGKDTGLWT